MNAADTTSKIPDGFDSSRTYTQLFTLLADGLTPSENFERVYEAEQETMQAVWKHTENCIDTLPSFIQSLSHVLALAAISGELDMNDVASIAWLTKDLGNLLEACTTINSHVEYALKQRAAA